MSRPAYCDTTADDGRVAVAETDGETAGLLTAGVVVDDDAAAKGVGDGVAAPSGDTRAALVTASAEVVDAGGALAWWVFWQAVRTTASAARAATDVRFLATTPPA
jgi:hypothetical protein